MLFGFRVWGLGFSRVFVRKPNCIASCFFFFFFGGGGGGGGGKGMLSRFIDAK